LSNTIQGYYKLNLNQMIFVFREDDIGHEIQPLFDIPLAMSHSEKLPPEKEKSYLFYFPPLKKTSLFFAR
jgi:hypothetical protein